MSILKYKYKVHKFVNYAFYLVVFIVGFLLGFTTNKIDFNKLISQALMIDNVSAYTIYEDEQVTINDEFIYNMFVNRFEDFSLETTPYIMCEHQINSKYITCSAHSNISHYYVSNTYSSHYILGSDEYDGIHVTLRYRFSNNVIEDVNSIYDITHHSASSTASSIIFDSSSTATYTNFDISLIDGVDSKYSQKINVLDFYKSTLNYWLNDGSIFKDENHQDFKEICWENFDELMFSVTIDSSYDGSSNIYVEGQQDGETYVKNGFYVFDDVRKLKRGTRIKSLIDDDYKYDASTWLGGATFNHLHNITSDFYLMDTEDKLGIRYSDPIMALGNYDIVRQDSYYYDNLNKLLNATYVDFTYYYNVVNDFRYDIFYLSDEKEKFCIYIPNQFVVTTLAINELGGFVGDIPTHNDSTDSFVDVTITTGKLHFNQLFTIVTNFINSIKDTVLYINNFIYSFVISLHPLIQMFIFTVITLLIVKLIIGMVVK